jgi:hypothetical protein
LVKIGLSEGAVVDTLLNFFNVFGSVHLCTVQ